MISIGTDIGNLILENTLDKNTIGLNNSIERMTTGYKINRAKDDAAGYSIATDLNTKISSMLMVQQNTEQGISLLQTAESGLDNIMTLLQRLRDLAEQAGNEVYGDDSRAAMQAEADEIIEQIEQIRNTTNFNGINLFEGQPAGVNGGVTTTSAARTNRILSNSNVHINGENGVNISGHSERGEESQVTSVSVLDTIDEEIKTLSSSIKSNVAAQSQPNTFTPAPRAADIQGAVEIAGNSTQVVNIDGVDYTVRNRLSTSQSFSYTKDTTTGEVTFLSSNFTIKSQADVAHNIVVAGRSNYVYGGDMDDTIYVAVASNTIYGQGGDDIITTAQGVNGNLYGEDGNDTLIINGQGGIIYGGSGDDIIKALVGWTNVYGEDDNDIITLQGNNFHAYAGNGDDSITLVSGTNNIIDGGQGYNTFTGSSVDNTISNTIGANAFSVDFKSQESKTININGINYVVTNTTWDDNPFTYSITTDGQISFKSRKFKIEGAKDVSHNVSLDNYDITFYGGNLADTIINNKENNKVYALGGDDIITSSFGYSVYLYGGEGSDHIIIDGYGATAYGEAGNDIIDINGYGNRAYGGVGDDIINILENRNAKANHYAYGGDGDDDINISSQVTNTIAIGGNGSNTISDLGSNNIITGFSDLIDNAQSVSIAVGETKIIQINGINYAVSNRQTNETNAIAYSYNPVTDEVSFGAAWANIEGQKDKSHNVIINGSEISLTTGDSDDSIVIHGLSNVVYAEGGDDYVLADLSHWGQIHGGSGNDELVINASSTVYGDDGDDIITNNVNNNNTINGGAGDDTYYLNAACTPTDEGGNNIYYINTDNSSISGSTGDDTFYVNGDNNNINGQGGNDYYIMAGNNNQGVGGTGTNYYIDAGSGNTYINTFLDPSAGLLIFTYQGEVQTFTRDGKTYTVTNNAAGSNTLQYSFNSNTGIIGLIGSDFTIDSEEDKSSTLEIRGDNNIINGSNLNDKISVESGSNNVINGKDGNDTLISNSENNSLNGDNGNDTITINASTNQTVTGGNGDDTININSDNNTDISTGAGNDRVTGTGNNNTVNVESGNNNVLLNGNTNTITAGDGDNRLSVVGNDNSITSGNGANTIGVDGDNNTVSNGNGDSVFNILGDTNQVTTQDGNNELNISGDTNTITSGNGDDEYTVTGDNNTITTTGGNNEVELTGNENNYTGGVGVDDITIRGDRNHAEGGDSNDEFMISRGDNNYIDGNAGDRNTMINNGVDTEYYNVIDMTPNPFRANFKVDIGSSSDNYIGIEISFNLFDFEVDFSSIDGAIDALDAIDDLMSNVTRQLSTIGATINRLESAADAQDVKLNNLISSLSTIKDADIAVESSNFIRYQILQNATVTLMSATRNLRRENVLGIINGIR